MTHVDLVQNDYAAGEHRVLGRVTSIGVRGVLVDCDDSNLERVLAQPLFDFTTQTTASPTLDGDRYLAVLARSWDGTYILATPIHDEASCPFAATKSIPFEPLLDAGAAPPSSAHGIDGPGLDSAEAFG